MRFRWALGTLAGMLLLVVASALPAQAAPVRTAVWANFSSTNIVYGQAVTIGARLVDSQGHLVTGKVVKLEASIDATSWSNVGTRTADNGTCSFGVRPPRDLYYRLRFDGDADADPCVGRAVPVTVRVAITGPFGAVGSAYGRNYLLKGSVAPAHPDGTPITLEAYQSVNGVWKHVKDFTDFMHTRSGVYGFRLETIKLPYTGRWRIRAVLAADGDHARSVTGWKYVDCYVDPVNRFSGFSDATSDLFWLEKGTALLSFTWSGTGAAPAYSDLTLLDTSTGTGPSARFWDGSSGTRLFVVSRTGWHRLTVSTTGSWSAVLTATRILTRPRFLAHRTPGRTTGPAWAVDGSRRRTGSSTSGKGRRPSSSAIGAAAAAPSSSTLPTVRSLRASTTARPRQRRRRSLCPGPRHTTSTSCPRDGRSPL